jgi:glycosyltransferase involved in cell wall biosynthesis
MSDISIIIPTLDEELHVGRAVTSAAPLGRVYVLDSGSTDRTRELAKEAGGTVAQHSWSGYSEQKNWALANLGIDSEWVLFLDADEYLSPELREEIVEATSSGKFDGCYLPRQNIFLGRLLRHTWWYPDYQLRLFRARKGRYEDRLVHEHVLLDGEAGFLKEPIMHENLKGVAAWTERHIRYAALEAVEMRKARAGERSGDVSPRFFGSRAERRRAVKTRIWYRMPFRPAIRFFWLYVIKRGFLDGRQGRIYCQLLAAYEALIDANLLELDLREEREARKS